MASSEDPVRSRGPAVLLDASDPDLVAGDEVGEYVIEAKLGSGGFGTVYRARHPVIGKRAAVKVLARQYSSDPEMVSRFVSEARVVNTIRHANIIDIFSFGTLADGRRYFVMELLSGVPFDAYLREVGPLQPAQALAIMRGVARALDAAHAQGVVHRDLKPDNIFLGFDDEGQPLPKLLDFGIAKLRGAAATMGHKTRSGTPIGTPRYMSPEQCLGVDVDRRTDVYAFGVVCFEALTGGPPFDAESYLALMVKHTTEERPLASERRADLGGAFDAPLSAIMAREPADRPASVMEAFDLLLAASSAGAAERSDVELPRAPPHPEEDGDPVTARTAMAASSEASAAPASASNKRAALVVAVAVLVGVGLYAATGAWGTNPAPEAGPTLPAPARDEADPVSKSKTTAGVAKTSQSAAATPTRFRVRLRSNAAKAFAYHDGAALGALPGAFELDGEPGDELTIVVKAPGHRDASVNVELGTDSEVAVTLVPVASKHLNRDLEDPGL
jgi:serine/threonine-protein kinase